jgi:hypothetical protein
MAPSPFSVVTYSTLLLDSGVFYSPLVAEKRGTVLRPLKYKGFKEGSVTKIGADDFDTSTPLESNKSQ